VRFFPAQEPPAADAAGGLSCRLPASGRSTNDTGTVLEAAATNPNGLVITLPATAPDKISSTIVLKVTGALVVD
jgi:hypothetical protein